jgi:hypothetical protein
MGKSSSAVANPSVDNVQPPQGGVVIGGENKYERSGVVIGRIAKKRVMSFVRSRSMNPDTPRAQLELIGLERSLELVEATSSTAAVARRRQRDLETISDILGRLPEADERAYLHSGLCQTYLPHSRPHRDDTIWSRNSGRFTLMVTPGAVDGTVERPLEERRRRRKTEQGIAPKPLAASGPSFVGVPYGPKARLILIYLQSEGKRSRVVSLGESLSAFIRSVGLEATWGPKGNVPVFREQILRIARCTFTLQWQGRLPDGSDSLNLCDVKIASGLELALSASSWRGVVELDADFHAHLQEHAVPLDKRAIRKLSDNSMALDLYTLFAYRLPKLKEELHLSWGQLRAQLGAEADRNSELSRRIREALTKVLDVYPHAKVNVTRHGLLLRHSPPSVPSAAMVNGFRLLTGGKSS